MAPITFHLISVNDEHAFLDTVRSAQVEAKPHYVGHCEHWIHSPKSSLDALTGSGSEMQRWDYLVIANADANGPLALPSYLQDNTTIINHWSITAPANLTTPSDEDARKATPPSLLTLCTKRGCFAVTATPSNIVVECDITYGDRKRRCYPSHSM